MAKEKSGVACSKVNRKENNDDGYFTFPQESKITSVFIFTFANKVK
jgi:hypothetical protein